MNINFKNIKHSIIILLVLIPISYLVYVNVMEKPDTSKEPNDEVKDELLSLTQLNNSTLAVLTETKKLLAEKDKKIKALEEQIVKTNSKVTDLKSKRNEKVNSINSVVPDSLYRLLSGFKY